MKSIDYILLIVNCKKYKYKAELQKSEFLNTLQKNIKYFHIIGDLDMEKNYKIENDILYVKTKDDYNSLPHKIIEAYKAIYNEFDFKYILKTDDNQFPVENFYINITEYLNKNNHINYGGLIWDIKNTEYSPYWQVQPTLPKNIIMYPCKYAAGAFYLLSKRVIPDILSKEDKIKNEYLEDYAIGYYMDRKFKHSENLLYINTKLYLKEKENYTNN